MAGTAWTNPSGGFWPLGKITVAAAGTPVAVTQNVGPQQSGPGRPMQFSRTVTQFIFSNPLIAGAGAGKIYVCKKGYDHTQTNGVLLVISVPAVASGIFPEPQSLPDGCLLQGARVTPDDLYIDTDVNGSSVQVTAIYG